MGPSLPEVGFQTAQLQMEFEIADSCQIVSFLLGIFKMKLTIFLQTQFQDPEVMAAFSDVSKNPANITKYQNNPKIMAIINKLSSKFGAPPQP